MKNFNKIITFSLALVMILTSVFFVACDKEIIDNESTRLVLSTGALDGVFNPFYSSSGTDNTIIGMTQLSMFTTDKEGKLAYGADEACAVLDYEESYDANSDRTTYKFVLKNNLKFSDGKPLTINDVLFNMYVYLDPVYTGSSTMYSTDIVGLSEYRTQTANEDLWDDFDTQFDLAAEDRLSRLMDTLDDIYDHHKDGDAMTETLLKEELQAVIDENKGYADEITGTSADDLADKEYFLAFSTLIEDYETAKRMFKEELQSTYTLSKGTAEDISGMKGGTEKITLKTDTEAFLYNIGYIWWNEKADNETGAFEYKLGTNASNWDEQTAINNILNSYFPGQVNNVIYEGFSTTYELLTAFAADAKKAYFDKIDSDEKIENISGITYANFDQAVTVNGTQYAVPTFNADGSVATGNQVLQIVIKKVDPKAIWNFGFSIAPMHYYSSEELVAEFDYATNHFGVSYSDPNFMNNVIRDSEKMGVPVGAGPYKATTSTGDSSNVTKGTFWENNVVYFERNEHFEFPAKIKYVNYKVVDTKFMLTSLQEGDIHFAEPACKTETITELDKIREKGFDYNTVMTNGYGYIGINAEKVPNINVRRAIMHAINTQHCLDYYIGYAYAINRPMTRASWAYPKETDSLGAYYTFDSTGATSENLVKEAGYVKGSDGVYMNATTGDKLEYTFTVAGDSEDHPAYLALKTASEILNQHGFKITVQKDINALKKLNDGSLTVWAAAWGSGIDPDMYQLYHIDSLAGSTANWGYRAIRRDKGKTLYKEEWAIIQELSEKIDKAREMTDSVKRAPIYAEALDLVMQLAVELPTYQRSDLFAYNTKIIDVTTLTSSSDLTPYNGPLANLWEVSLNETK